MRSPHLQDIRAVDQGLIWPYTVFRPTAKDFYYSVKINLLALYLK